MTQVLLELCCLRAWAVVGMSIDYVKCFDLIPQAVVLALALELGMDPGTCRALGAMYKQLRHTFKIAGALGCWWQATNGILQGCPVSVLLVNATQGIMGGGGGRGPNPIYAVNYVNFCKFLKKWRKFLYISVSSV